MKKFVPLILILALVLLIVGASMLYDELSAGMAPPQLATQPSPSTEPPPGDVLSDDLQLPLQNNRLLPPSLATAPEFLQSLKAANRTVGDFQATSRGLTEGSG